MTMPKYEQEQRQALEYYRRYQRRQRVITFLHILWDLIVFVLGCAVIVLALTLYLR